MHRIFLLLVFAATLLSFTYSSQSASTGDVVPDTAATRALTRSAIIRKDFEESMSALYDSMKLSGYGLSFDVFRMGLIGYHNLRQEGVLNEKDLLTIIDFSRPGTEKRFYTLDLAQRKVRYHSYVAHGRNSGENFASTFSNRVSSNQSSLGFYVTGETYVGSKGYSLRLNGKDPDYNSNIRKRAVVIHAAEYVSEEWINRYGRLGRSFGCPALPEGISRSVIDTIKDGTAIFAYYPDRKYLESSEHLDIDHLIEQWSKTAPLTGFDGPAE